MIKMKINKKECVWGEIFSLSFASNQRTPIMFLELHVSGLVFASQNLLFPPDCDAR